MSKAASIFVRALFFLSGLWPCAGDCQAFQNVNAVFPFAASEEIFQDKEGFLWIGTINGLVRYDGYETLIYTHDPNDRESIPANNINAIGQDSSGRIWIGLRAHGLCVLDSELLAFVRICLPDSSGSCLQDISVNDVAVEQDGTMWAGTSRGLFQLSADVQPRVLRAFHHTKDTSGLTSSYIQRLLMDSRQRLWVATVNGIHLFRRDQLNFIHHPLQTIYPSGQIMDIGEDRKRNIWLSPRFTEARLFVYNEATREFQAAPVFSGPEYGEFRFTFRQDELWIISRGVGVYHLDAAGQQTYFKPTPSALHGYRNTYGIEIITDRYDNVWITGGSLMLWPATQKGIRHFDSDHNPVISVCADSDRIWYCDNEPRRFNIAKGTHETYWPVNLPTNMRSFATDPLNVRRIYQLKEYDLNHVIMTTTRNVIIWNKTTDRFSEYALDYGGPFRDFVVSDDHTHVWICGNQGSPILLNLKTGEYQRPEYASAIRNPVCVDKSDSGDLWFGSGSDGVFKLDAETHTVINFAPNTSIPSQKLTDYYVNDIAIDADQNVWIGTNLGINKIDPNTNTLTYLRKQKHFENESVMSLLVDKAGDLWFGTPHGLVRYQPRQHVFSRYDRADGLLNAVYTERACYRDNSGLLYFGGDRGVDIIDPAQMGINTIPPDLYIGRILVNNVSPDTSRAPHHIRALELRHTENFLEIELLALHLTAPAANTYAYRIPEIDTTWRELGTQRRITLANMQPGEYTIQARAANADGVWCKEKSLLDIRIKPPYWATWWFAGLCLLAIVSGLYLGYRYRIQQIRTRERLKTEFNKRVAELESKALRAQMNPHFLFNSLNSVKSLIVQGLNERATQYLTQFGQLIRQVLANSEKPFVRLQEELEALRLYLNIEQLRFQNFTYDIQVELDVDTDFIEVPPLILQPYVENAIWHGLMHKTDGARKLYVHVAQDGQFLELTVEDNGIGRDRARQMKMRGDTRKGGMGMRLTTDRLNLLHQLYGKEVSITIDDLHDDKQKPSGTRVRIRIPYSE